jgi:hypothetical protein
MAESAPKAEGDVDENKPKPFERSTLQGLSEVDRKNVKKKSVVSGC